MFSQAFQPPGTVRFTHEGRVHVALSAYADRFVMVGAALALQKQVDTRQLIISARASGEPLATQRSTARFDVCLRSYLYQLENTS
jgi:hypothetical protein